MSQTLQPIIFDEQGRLISAADDSLHYLGLSSSKLQSGIHASALFAFAPRFNEWQQLYDHMMASNSETFCFGIKTRQNFPALCQWLKLQVHAGSKWLSCQISPRAEAVAVPNGIMQQMIDSLPQPVLLYSAGHGLKWKQVFANKAATKISNEQPENSNFSDPWHPPGDVLFDQQWQNKDLTYRLLCLKAPCGKLLTDQNHSLLENIAFES